MLSSRRSTAWFANAFPGAFTAWSTQRWFAGGLLLIACSTGLSQIESGRIFDRESYDVLTLTPKYGGGNFKIFPIDAPDRREPEDVIKVRLLEYADEYYEIAWKDIARYQSFAEIVLAEANRLIEEKDFDAAFHHLAFLRTEYPRLSGLDETIGSLIFQDAGNAYQQGNFAEALSLLDEVRRIDPTKASLISATENVATKMFERYINDKDYPAARSMLAWAESRFGGKMAKTIAEWEMLLGEQAKLQLDRARQQAAAGDYQAAYDLSQQAIRTWPTLPGGGEFAAEIVARYPVVKVGVTRPAKAMDPRRAEDWASRRTGRLRYRTLVEIQGYGPDGGEYLCPVGTIEVSPDSREILIRLKQSDRGSIADLFSGYDLANILLEMARPGGKAEVPLWSQLVGSIRVEDVYSVRVTLRQPVLNPVALLQTPLSQLNSEDGKGATNPYFISDRNERRLRLVLNENYVAKKPNQPVEIVEIYYDDPAAVVSALLAGEIDVIDRLYPGDVTTLRRRDDIEVRPYAVPSIHFLVPNFKQPLMQQRAFRRALVYGISRKTILEQDLLGSQSVAGCRLISGPMPPGVGTDDPLGYAYEERIKPRGYEPTLALTLAQVARGQLQDRQRQSGEAVDVARPLVLVHPAAAVPRIASSAIAQYLTAIGIACETQELRAGETQPLDNDWDLLYVDMVITEPMFDVRQLLGAQGLIAGGSSYLELALRRLGVAVSWEESRETLHEIHRLAHEEVAVIPLWQISEYFAFSKRLRGVGEFPLSLYQGVENWQMQWDPSLAGGR